MGFLKGFGGFFSDVYHSASKLLSSTGFGYCCGMAVFSLALSTLIALVITDDGRKVVRKSYIEWKTRNDNKETLLRPSSKDGVVFNGPNNDGRSEPLAESRLSSNSDEELIEGWVKAVNTKIFDKDRVRTDIFFFSDDCEYYKELERRSRLPGGSWHLLICARRHMLDDRIRRCEEGYDERLPQHKLNSQSFWR